ncbi:hypothetical protein ACFLY6_01865 [Candidatus Dependentiae bacterium]
MEKVDKKKGEMMKKLLRLFLAALALFSVASKIKAGPLSFLESASTSVKFPIYTPKKGKYTAEGALEKISEIDPVKFLFAAKQVIDSKKGRQVSNAIVGFSKKFDAADLAKKAGDCLRLIKELDNKEVLKKVEEVLEGIKGLDADKVEKVVDFLTRKIQRSDGNVVIRRLADSMRSKESFELLQFVVGLIKQYGPAKMNRMIVNLCKAKTTTAMIMAVLGGIGPRNAMKLRRFYLDFSKKTNLDYVLHG